ncbi:hypothetical protein EDB19DRAFT_1834046 [Suillus lakei]|nr:hypothetical protein EDB19DRAFT_1834046 [Suillus lakei]
MAQIDLDIHLDYWSYPIVVMLFQKDPPLKILKILQSNTIQPDSSLVAKTSARETSVLTIRNSKHSRNIILNQASSNQTTSSLAAKSPKKISAENDIPALDLSTLFLRKSHSYSEKSMLLSTIQPAKRLYVVLNKISSNQDQTSSDFSAADVVPAYVMKSQSNYGTPSQSSNVIMCSEDPPYNMNVDQAIDANSSLGHTSPATLDSCPDLPKDIASSSLAVTSDHLEEFDPSMSTPPGTPPLSENDLQMPAPPSPCHGA